MSMNNVAGIIPGVTNEENNIFDSRDFKEYIYSRCESVLMGSTEYMELQGKCANACKDKNSDSYWDLSSQVQGEAERLCYIRGFNDAMLMKKEVLNFQERDAFNLTEKVAVSDKVGCLSMNSKLEKVTVQRAADLTGTSPLTIRMGIIRGELPFGSAVHTSKHRTNYVISAQKLADYLGVSAEDVL